MDELTKKLKEESEKLADEYLRHPTAMDYMVFNSVLVRGFIMGCNHAKGIFYPKPPAPVPVEGTLEKALSAFCDAWEKK